MVVGADWISAVIIAVTVPLIPLFMALVGASTKVRMHRQARLLQRLAGHFLDVVAGLPTLKVFGRAKAQAAAVRDITNRYRTATMATLRVAFLSSLILELLATFSVALVAVAIGLRLLGGHLSFATALFVLILAPEAYLPAAPPRDELPRQRRRDEGGRGRLRGPGRPFRTRAPTDVPDPSRSASRSTDSKSPTRSAASRPCTVCRLRRAGRGVAIAGPSGVASPACSQFCSDLCPPRRGSDRLDGIDLADLDPDVWRTQVAWVPQRPHLFARSIADNVRLGRPDATDHQVRAGHRCCRARRVVAACPTDSRPGWAPKGRACPRGSGSG